MSIKVKSNNYTGIEASEVEIEVDIGRGLPGFYIIGLGDAAVLESRERVKTALKNIGVIISDKKIIVNLSPAAQKKEGSHFDLGVAIGILAGVKAIVDTEGILERYLILGELSLDGRIKGVRGAIASVILGRENGYTGIILPFDNYHEASLIPNIEVIPARNLNDIKQLFTDLGKYKETIMTFIKPKDIKIGSDTSIDFSEVKGQSKAKRALEIAIAGGHNILLIGSPGSGKTMLAKRIITIMPPMSNNEIIESTKIYSISGELDDNSTLIDKRPFRSPHHTASRSSIIGGGKSIKAGEITLAHNGVLFLDEFNEFPRDIIEGLRQPIEDGVISISRLAYKVTLPCRFILLAAANPCRCGLLFEKDGSLCRCSHFDLKKYVQKLSGPILDRIDLIVEIVKLKENELLDDIQEETSFEIRERVLNVREIQKKRFKKSDFFEKLNGNMSSKDMENFCFLNSDEYEYARTIIEKFNLSPRSYYKILKVARTIADLEGAHMIEKKHLLESLNYRKRSDNI